MSDEKKPSIRRQDRAGHFDPAYAKSLLEKAGHDDPGGASGFVHGTKTRDALAEELAEDAVATATSGEDTFGDHLQQRTSEDVGGPFVTTSAGAELADDTDASNPEDATREPFPTT